MHSNAYFAPRALLPEGWASDVRIEIDSVGTIAAVTTGGEAAGAETLRGTVLPGMANLHGHAFQRAMAGLAERLGPGEESFWTWREVMYRFLGRIGPDHQRAIAAQLYVEMLEAGYTAAGEFHYLHNAPDGSPYADSAEMAHQIVAAADHTGIGLTLLPVLYMTGNFGGEPATEGQRRFLMDIDGFGKMVERLRPLLASNRDRMLGVAPHSLRAVPDAALMELLDLAESLLPGAPIHIHVAEQVKEVRDCLEWCGKRPLAHLMEIAEVDERWCIIHATHLDDDEVERLADCGAVAGLCPTTEGNLGDGFFRLGDWLAANGRFGIGSDSHVSISPVEELRLLDYAQRMLTLHRITGATRGSPHAGAHLWRTALAGGAQALGRPTGRIAAGSRADLVVIDDAHPILYGREGDLLLDSLVFSGNVPLVRDVMVGGTWRVRDGRHPERERIAEAYRRTLGDLTA